MPVMEMIITAIPVAAVSFIWTAIHRVTPFHQSVYSTLFTSAKPRVGVKAKGSGVGFQKALCYHGFSMIRGWYGVGRKAVPVMLIVLLMGIAAIAFYQAFVWQKITNEILPRVLFSLAVIGTAAVFLIKGKQRRERRKLY